MPSDLVSKYNVAGPRYTSYPTVPYWNKEKLSLKAWKRDTIQNSTQMGPYPTSYRYLYNISKPFKFLYEPKNQL